MIERAKAGDHDAFCDLARSYQQRVYLAARSFCATAEDAEDLSQEVWLRVYRSLPQFRGDSGFYTWVRQIMLHTFLNVRRASGREPCAAAPELSQSDLAFDSDAERKTVNRLLAGQAIRALQEMPEQQRMIVILKHVEGMTYEEIARALRCSTGSVKKALFRAIQKLRARMNVDAISKEKLTTDA